ncbi:DUF2490 domain-containing protein [Chryseolinea sp. T2]|uniref:DUF2490 domain-containing protein n=1 Tax=Chryseolinea sp. T2 TaxID=3129255 RepID=UPI003076D953
MRFSLLLVAICLSLVSAGQPKEKYTHNVFWGRIALADNITSKLRVELWLQKRTQDTEAHTSIFNAPQYDSYWLWFNYALSPNLKLAISPFGYFQNYVLYTEPADLDRPAIKEFRYTLRLEHEQKGSFVNYSNRYSIEYRTRDIAFNGHYEPNWRFRYMARLEKPIHAEWLNGKSLSLILYDEVMIQFGKAVKDSPSIFDQNRIYAGFSYSLMKNIKITPGYLFVIQQRPSGDVLDYVNTFWVVLAFDNVISQFIHPPKGTDKQR